MDYQKIYDQIVDRAKKRELEGYSEKHHIIPKCMGGSNRQDNLAVLTAREHFICHWLLHKMHPNNSALSFAFKMMATTATIFQYRFTPSSRAIQEAKQAGATASSKLLKGVKKSKEHVEKVASANIGKKRTKEVRAVLSAIKLGKPSGAAKGVFQSTLEGVPVKWHRTTLEAAKETGIESSNIQAAASGKYKQSGGFKWTYGQPQDSVRIEKAKKVATIVASLHEDQLDTIIEMVEKWKSH